MKKIILLLLWVNTSVYSQNKVSKLLENGQYLQAIEYLKKQKDSPVKYQTLAKIYDKTGNDNLAIKYYEKCRKNDKSKSISLSLEKVYERNGYYYKAIRLVEEVLSKNKTNLLLKYKLSRLYQKTHQDKKALQLLQELRIADAANPNYDYQMARIYNDVNLKINTFMSAYKKDNKHIKSVIKLAYYYKLINFKDSAEIMTKIGLKLNPYQSKLLQYQVLNLARKRQYKSALQLLERMDSILPKNAFVMQTKGWVFLQQKKYTKAEELLKKALKIDNNTQSTYYYLGQVYKNIQKPKLALQYYQLAIRMAKPDIDKEYFAMGKIYKTQKKYKKAIDNFAKAFENNHKNYHALFEQANLSDIYYKDPSIAINLFKNYLKLFEKKDTIKTKHARKRIEQMQ